MGYGLLGVHVNSTVSGLPETVRAWRPPLVVILDHSDVWHAVKAGSPDTLFVGRVYQEFEPDFNNPALDPTSAARRHCEMILPWAERMGKTYSYWQGVNEPVVHSGEAMRRFAAFDAERARIMDGHGFQVVVGSFSVGNPAKLAHWQHFLPALEAARQFRGALALHEYAWPTLDRDWPWYLLRHRKVYDGEPRHGWDGFPRHLKTLPLLITECGLDGLLEEYNPPRGWKVLYDSDQERYLDQLAWYDAALQKDPYVVGAAIYCCGVLDHTWKSYDVWPDLAGRIAERAQPIYRRDIPEPPDPRRPIRRLPPTGPRRRPYIVSHPAKVVPVAVSPHSTPRDEDAAEVNLAAAPAQAYDIVERAAGKNPGQDEESAIRSAAEDDVRAALTTRPSRPEVIDESELLRRVSDRLDQIIRLLQE